ASRFPCGPRGSGAGCPTGLRPRRRRAPGMGEVFTERTPRVVAARKLTRRAGRDAAGQFLAEGPQAVREALAHDPPPVELFVTDAASERHAALGERAHAAGAAVGV